MGTHRIWVWRNVFVVCWYGSASAASADRMTEITGEVLAGLPAGEKFSYVHLIRNKLTLPDAETRAALLESTRRFEGRFALSGVIVPGGGFWSSAVRGFITGIAVLAPRALDLRIFGDAQQLIRWFTPEHGKRTGVQIDGDALLKILEDAEASCAQLQDL